MEADAPQYVSMIKSLILTDAIGRARVPQCHLPGDKTIDRFGLLLFIGIGSILVLVFIVSQWLEKRRTDAWRRAAEALRLPFLGANNDILNRTAGFKVLSEGIRQRFYNAVEADADNVRITVGDFSYRTRTSNGTRGSKSKRHVRTLCVLETNTLDTPHGHLRPQRAVFDKLGALLGGQDINFDDDPAFSDAYVLQGEQESAVHELFDAQTRLVCRS